MWPDLYTTAVPYGNLILRAAVVYFAIVLLLRVSGKRQMGQMNASEFVAVLLISNAVQNAMNAGDNSLTGGIVLAATLIVLSWLVSVLTFRSERMSWLLEGSPTLLIHNGKIVEAARKRELLSENEVMTLLRKNNVHEISEVKTGILEADGHLSVTKFREERDDDE